MRQDFSYLDALLPADLHGHGGRRWLSTTPNLWQWSPMPATPSAPAR